MQTIRKQFKTSKQSQMYSKVALIEGAIVSISLGRHMTEINFFIKKIAMNVSFETIETVLFLL